MGKHKIFQIGIKALIQNSKNQILLFQINPVVLKSNTHGTYWDIPGGRIESADSVETTLRRELLEEAGISGILDHSFFHASIANIEIPTDNGPVGLALFIYRVTVPDATQIALSTEHQKFGWFNPLEASELLKIKYPQELTDKIRQL